MPTRVQTITLAIALCWGCTANVRVTSSADTRDPVEAENQDPTGHVLESEPNPTKEDAQNLGDMKLAGIDAQYGLGASSNEFLRVEDGTVGSEGSPGEVRITCTTSHFAYDDPIVSPGQPESSHLHNFFGNVGTDANSTYESLRDEPGGSTCAGGGINKSAYWFPALIDAESNQPVYPTLVFVYYKTGYWGQSGADVSELPDGLRMVAGDAAATEPQPEWAIRWSCTTHGGDGVPLEALQSAPSIPDCAEGELLDAAVLFPQCWDGENFDSEDHKSHVAHPEFSGECPSTHPVLLPQITIQATWEVGPEGTTALYLSNDMMTPDGSPPGLGLHADFFEAWEPEFKDAFVANCLNRERDCGVRSLGDGHSLVDPADA